MSIQPTTSIRGFSVTNPPFYRKQIRGGRLSPPVDPQEITKPNSFCSFSNVTKPGIIATIVSLGACVFGCVKENALLKWLGLVGSAVSAGVSLVGSSIFKKPAVESQQIAERNNPIKREAGDLTRLRQDMQDFNDFDSRTNGNLNVAGSGDVYQAHCLRLSSN